VFPLTAHGASFGSPEAAKARNYPLFDQSLRNLPVPSPLAAEVRAADDWPIPLARAAIDPPYHGPDEAPGEVALGQQQPAVAGVLTRGCLETTTYL
jgi:hypothetical protein